MKRILLFALTIALVCSMLCYPISAEEYSDPYDSRLIPDAIQDLNNYDNAEVVFRSYTVNMLSSNFTKSGSIEEILAACKSIYVLKESDAVHKYTLEEDGKAYSAQTESRFSVGRSTHELITQEAISTVSPDIQIECVYYLHEQSDYFYSNAIYYKTNLGDYVYFEAHEYAPMLMGAEQFYDFLDAWRMYIAYRESIGMPSIGVRSVLQADWSVYDWTSPEFDPDAPLPLEKEAEEPEFPWLIVGIGAAVLAAAAVTTVLIIRRKKKKTEPEEIGETPEET